MNTKSATQTAVPSKSEAGSSSLVTVRLVAYEQRLVHHSDPYLAAVAAMSPQAELLGKQSEPEITVVDVVPVDTQASARRVALQRARWALIVTAWLVFAVILGVGLGYFINELSSI